MEEGTTARKTNDKMAINFKPLLMIFIKVTGRLFILLTDLSKSEQAKAIAEHGHVDIVLNNAP